MWRLSRDHVENSPPTVVICRTGTCACAGVVTLIVGAVPVFGTSSTRYAFTPACRITFDPSGEIVIWPPPPPPPPPPAPRPPPPLRRIVFWSVPSQRIDTSDDASEK